jgi:hypothetical protein
MENYFNSFLESLKTKENETLIENLQDGLNSVAEPSTQREVVKWELVDTQGSKVIKTYAPDKVRYARRLRDKLDLDYGAVRYFVRPVYNK